MKQIFLLLLLVSIFISVQAQEQKRLQEFNLEKGVAVKGYDVVAYFKEGKAVKGSSSLAVVYQGVKYYFSTVANKEEFKAKADAHWKKFTH